MDILQAIKARRSIRLFKQDAVSDELFTGLIEAGRCAPSGANCQPLEYVVVNDGRMLDGVFAQLAWAGYIKPKRTPSADLRPTAYIVVLVNGDICSDGAVDAAAAIENILLAACAKGIGSCWIGSVKRDELKKILTPPDNYSIDSVIALGYPAEEPVLEDCCDESIKYYLDENDRLHVPKRPLKAIMHINKFGKLI
jgi:nitroreductase